MHKVSDLSRADIFKDNINFYILQTEVSRSITSDSVIKVKDYSEVKAIVITDYISLVNKQIVCLYLYTCAAILFLWILTILLWL